MRPSLSSLSPALLLTLLPTCLAQIGAISRNVSSNSTQMSYAGTWRSNVLSGVYQAYSNESGAAVTFTFTGVKASYIAVKKSDRGLCQLRLDDTTSYTVDLYDDSGYLQAEKVVWTSAVLPYGVHNVTLQQLGPDARFGYYPYLFTETWVEAVPENVASYIATQTTATPTSTPTSSSPSSQQSGGATNIAPVVGGVVGGVIAIILLAFLWFLYRRDKRNSARGGKMPKVRKGDGKMTIEDDPIGGPPAMSEAPRPTSSGGAGGAGGWGNTGYNGRSSQDPYSNSNPAASPYYGQQGSSPPRGSQSSHPHQNGNYSSPPPSSSPYYQSPVPAPVSSPYYHSTQSNSHPPPQGYNLPSNDYDQRAGYGPVALDGGREGAYPYHTQGFGEERRNYPIPEI